MRRKTYINWAALGTQVGIDRAGGRCECWGQCGQHIRKPFSSIAADNRCNARIGHLDESGEWVKLTPVPLDRVPHHVELSNLLAMCQPCRRRFEAQAAKAVAEEPEGLFDLPGAGNEGALTL